MSRDQHDMPTRQLDKKELNKKQLQFHSARVTATNCPDYRFVRHCLHSQFYCANRIWPCQWLKIWLNIHWMTFSYHNNFRDYDPSLKVSTGPNKKCKNSRLDAKISIVWSRHRFQTWKHLFRSIQFAWMQRKAFKNLEWISEKKKLTWIWSNRRSRRYTYSLINSEDNQWS